MKAAMRPTEAGEQEVVVRYCELRRLPLVHIPNEGKRSAAYAAQMKRMGLAKGFPDLFIPVAASGFHGLFIELKRDRKEKATEPQKAWIAYLNKAGYRATVCHGAEEAIREIENYIGGGNEVVIHSEIKID